jgi:hypothetical protein
MDAATIPSTGESGLVTIKGVVVPVAWDRDGTVTALALATVDEEEFLLADNEAGRELRRWMHQAVEVRGVISQERGGHQVFTTHHYCLAPPRTA